MDDRKQRLAALAAKAGRGTLQNNDNVDPEQHDDSATDINNNNVEDDAQGQEIQHNNSKRKIRFRNYIPSDPKLIENDQTRNDTSVDSVHMENKKARIDGDIDDLSMVHGKGTKSALQIALDKARSEISIHSNQLSNDHSRQTTNPSLKHDNITTSTTTNSTTTEPPKINADLKRNIQTKLNLLEKRTQKALICILRDRLEQEATATATTPTTIVDLD
jgi:hypothetical protein